MQRRISAIRDFLGFKDYRYRLAYFPRSPLQKRRPQPAKKTVSDGEVHPGQQCALAPVVKRLNIRGLNDAASSDRSSASEASAATCRESLARYRQSREKRSERGEPAGLRARQFSPSTI